MYRSTIALLIPLALAGCAHQSVAPVARAPEAREAEAQIAGSPAAGDRAPADVLAPEVQSTDVQTNRDQGPPRLKPDNDPRYALPSAQKRSLSIFLGSQTFEYVEDDQVVASGKVSTGTRSTDPRGQLPCPEQGRKQKLGEVHQLLQRQHADALFVFNSMVPISSMRAGCPDMRIPMVACAFTTKTRG